MSEVSKEMPVSKKLKTEDEEAEEGTVIHRNKEGDGYIELSDKRRVTIRSWKNNLYVDIREFWVKDSNEVMPGKKGILLNMDQFQKLRTAILDGTIDAEIKSLQDK